MSKSNNKITEDGGPAFPVPSHVFDHVERGELLGMSLRLWLASQALSNPKIVNAYADTPDDAAIVCLGYADAIIEGSQRAIDSSCQPAWVLFSELDGAMVPREVYADRASAEQALLATALPSATIVLMLSRGPAETCRQTPGASQ